MRSIIINRRLWQDKCRILWHFKRTDDKENEMVTGAIDTVCNADGNCFSIPSHGCTADSGTETNVLYRREDHHSTAVILRTISAANSFEAAGPFAVIILPSETTGLFTRTAPLVFISRNDAGFS